VSARGYVLFDHTADIGVRARGRTREELFAHAAQGLMAAVADLRGVREATSRELDAIAFPEADDAELLVTFLQEVLYASSVERLLFRRFEVSFPEAGRATARAHGEPISRRHRVLREVKAVTYHRARVERTASGFRGAVILDI